MATTLETEALALLEQLDTPIALIEPVELRILCANAALSRWLGLEQLPSTLPEALPALAEPKIAARMAAGSPVSVQGRAKLRRGPATLVEYQLRMKLVGGNALWVLEGSDQSKAELKQQMLEQHSQTIEVNNRLLQHQKRKLDESNQQMRLVLDNVGQGLMVVTATGEIESEHSAALARWFGAPEGRKVWDYLAAIDAHTAAWLGLGIEALFEGVLPMELSLAQLPLRLEATSRSFSLVYHPVLARDGRLDRLLVIVTDMTAELERHRAEEEQQEILQVLEHLGRDRSGFLDMLHEASERVDKLTAGPPGELEETLRELHTLKGNCGLFGLARMGELCHELETRLLDERRRLFEEEREHLREQWSGHMRRLGAVMGQETEGKLLVDRDDYRDLVGALSAVDHPQLLTMVQAWLHEPLSLRLQLLAAQASEIARRQSKSLRVEVQADGLRLPREQWRSVREAMVHLVRNAIDHGIEPPEQRAEAGKPSEGLIVLRARLLGRELVVSIHDDGGGIDWERVAQRAAALGLPHHTRQERIQALFSNAFSTRGTVSQLSGRGIGLAVVREAVARLGGSISLETEPGQGTVFSMSLPM
jgi:two-component system chemotaxis sensor kinase CheA